MSDNSKSCICMSQGLNIVWEQLYFGMYSNSFDSIKNKRNSQQKGNQFIEHNMNNTYYVFKVAEQWVSVNATFWLARKSTWSRRGYPLRRSVRQAEGALMSSSLRTIAPSMSHSHRRSGRRAGEVVAGSPLCLVFPSSEAIFLPTPCQKYRSDDKKHILVQQRPWKWRSKLQTFWQILSNSEQGDHFLLICFFVHNPVTMWCVWCSDEHTCSKWN